MYYLGLDGGGTQSRLMACDEQGGLYGPWRGGPTNLASNPEGAVREALRELLGAFARATGGSPRQVTAICVGSAGVDRPANRRQWEALLAAPELELDCPRFAVNDVEIILEAETGGGPGAVLLSGTGSAAWGRNGARVHRCGGWGHILGDEGSGYWIGREALRLSLRAADGRGEPTALRSLLEAQLCVRDIRDALGIAYAPGANKASVAALSVRVEQAAAEGDPVALDILRRAAGELADLADTTARALGFGARYPLILCGGVLQNALVLLQFLRPILVAMGADARPISREPCLGAVLLARRLAGETQFNQEGDHTP